MSYASLEEKARISYWKRQIDFAKDRAQPYFDISDVLIKQYQNEPTSEREKSIQDFGEESHLSRVKANLVFGWIDQSIANLLERNPTFSVEALNRDGIDGAPVVTAISNYWYRETDQLRQDERILLDAFLCPYGVKKLGWTVDVHSRMNDFEDELDEVVREDFENNIEAENLYLATGIETRVTREQDHILHIEAHTQALQDPSLDELAQNVLEDHIRQHEKLQNEPEPDRNQTIQYEAPYGVRWNPADFLVDPMAQDGLNDAQWVAFRSQRRLDDIKSNPNYKNLEGLEPNTRPDQAPAEDQEIGHDDFGLVTLWEIWVRDFAVSPRRRRDLLLVIAEGHDKFLREEDEWPFSHMEGFPCEVVNFQQTVNSWFAKPTLAMAGADNIQALANEILDSYLYIIRKQKNILLYDSDTFEGYDIDSMLTAPDMSAFPIRGLSEKPNAVQPVDFGRIPNEKGEMLSLIQSLFDRAAGTPQPIASPAGSADTATQASILERRVTAREARRGTMLAEFQVRTARKFWQLTTQFRPDKAFLIHPRAGEWMEVTEDIARGEYRFRIDISSQSTNLAMERKNQLDLLNLFAGLAGLFQQLYGQPPNLVKIAERLLTRGFDEQAPEEILPMLQQMQGDQPMDLQQQAAVIQGLAGTPGEAPQNGPGVTTPPREAQPENTVGAAMPAQFRQPAPSTDRTSSVAETG